MKISKVVAYEEKDIVNLEIARSHDGNVAEYLKIIHVIPIVQMWHYKTLLSFQMQWNALGGQVFIIGCIQRVVKDWKKTLWLLCCM